LTVLNLLPSMATLAFRQQAYLSAKGDERTHTLRTVGPLSSRKSATVL
jgi:hypothetical protein